MLILICEDNPIVALDLEMTVEDLGHISAGITRSAAECRSRCIEQSPDLVLVDLDLADGATGLGLVDHLAASGISSVIVSGRADTIGPTRAVDVLGKPLKVGELKKTLIKVFGTSQIERQPT